MRCTGRRILLMLIAATIVFSVLVFHWVHYSKNGAYILVKNFDQTFKVERRVVFDETLKVDKTIAKRLVANVDRVSKGSKKLPLIYTGEDLTGSTASETKSGHSEFKIPRIIHQTWRDAYIPKSTADWARSFRYINKNFEYWFWTDKDALELVRRKYPAYLKYFTSYSKAIQKADAMRYFVLHQFGGFYADLDIAAVKSMDDLARTHYSIISQEPWVHAKVYWAWPNLMPCNAFMASAPKHAFMELLITTLPMNFRNNHADDVMNKTGPMMLDRTLKKYRQLRTSNYIPSDTLYLAEPNLFHPQYDPNLRQRYIQGCEDPEKYHLVRNEIAECKEARARDFNQHIPDEAYTNHHWMHYWVGGIFINRINPHYAVHIKHVVSDVKNVSELLLKLTPS